MLCNVSKERLCSVRSYRPRPEKAAYGSAGAV